MHANANSKADVNSLCAWTDANYLKFNATKYKYMIISRKKHPVSPNYPLHINNCCLERINSYIYLGVWLTSNLNWSLHILQTCKKARQQVGIIYCRFYGHANSSTLLRLYLSFVRPHLEYVASVRDPCQQGLKSSILSLPSHSRKYRSLRLECV